MFDAFKKRLQEIQSPEHSGKLVDDKYKHIRCPTHRRSVKHRVNAANKITPTYCCDELKALYEAARLAQRPRAAASPEIPVQGPEVPVQEAETSGPQEASGGSTPKL